MLGVKTVFITLGSPLENGFNERSRGSLRDEILNGEVFYTMAEANILIEGWRKNYNEVQTRSSLGYKSPAKKVLTKISPEDMTYFVATPLCTSNPQSEHYTT